MYSCPTHVDAMVDRAWETIVLQEVQTRKGMGSIPSMNAAVTSQCLYQLEGASQNIMVKYLTGLLVFGDAAKHWGSGDGSCPYCLDPEDSQTHRVLHCNAFSEIRSRYVETFEWLHSHCPYWPSLPVIPRSCDEEVLRQWTNSHPINIDLPLFQSDETQRVKLYTDGSCINPTRPECSVATWAVVHDSAHESEHFS